MKINEWDCWFFKTVLLKFFKCTHTQKDSVHITRFLNDNVKVIWEKKSPVGKRAFNIFFCYIIKKVIRASQVLQ